VDIGRFDNCADECPSALRAELEELREKVCDQLAAGRAYAETMRDADSMRHSPGGWVK
jgi:hypothetical protein